MIPGEVDVDLLNEHMARYTFASRLARGKRVLDAGCGAGYGSAELARAAGTGGGRGPRAGSHRVRPRPLWRIDNLSFEEASCEALPHAEGSFELVVAFEVIEHLEDWRGFLREARRVLVPNGQLVVSTPNKLYYTESRGPDGANPFHVHEFDFEEFRAELIRRLPARFAVPRKSRRGLYVSAARSRLHRGSARGRRRSGARRIALLRSGMRQPAADRQPHLRLRAARPPTCCASASAISAFWKRSWTRRTSGWRKRSATSPR